MWPAVKVFRDIAVQTCRTRKFPFATFMDEYGLAEILDEANEKKASEIDIAGEVLWRCCVADGCFNNFFVGILTVMTYLNERRGRLGDGELQAFTDLCHILRNNPSRAAIRGWIDTHYPF